MPTDVEICSMALRAIRANPITAFADATNEARLASAFYASTRDACLRAARWNFAKTRKALQPLAEAPAYGYAKQFLLPTDPYCLRLTEVVDADKNPIKHSLEGRHILADESTVYISFIGRITETEVFDTLFLDALIFRLAAVFAYPITGRDNVVKTMMQAYELKMIEARNVDRAESHQPKSEAENIVDDR